MSAFGWLGHRPSEFGFDWGVAPATPAARRRHATPSLLRCFALGFRFQPLALGDFGERVINAIAITIEIPPQTAALQSPPVTR